jgi:hypothetical protein
MMNVERTGADGFLYGTFSYLGDLGNGNHLLAAPTERATKGVFRYSTQTTLANPQLTMTVDKPEHRPLNVLTRAYADRGMKFGTLDQGWVPFTKNQTRQLVDAGFGDPQDTKGLDLHGKLALLRYGDRHDGTPQCFPLMDRVEAVRQAGAAGVVWFPTNGCQVPLWPTDLSDPQTQMSLPEAWLSPAEGQHLADLAGKGSVRIDINADPNIRYTYELKEYEEQQIPSSLTYTYTSRDLAEFDTAFHASEPEAGFSAWHAYKPGTTLSVVAATDFAAPQTRPVYVGPLSSNVVWWELSLYGKEHYGPYRKIDQPIRSDNPRNTVPIAPGIISLDAVHKAQQDGTSWTTCRLCREGDTFWGAAAGGDAAITSGNGAEVTTPGLVSQTEHLYRADGEEVPSTPQGPFRVPGYTLPQQPGAYRLVDDRVFSDGTKSGTTWTFTSPGSAKQTTRNGYTCLGNFRWGSTDACQPEPVVFLSYDLGDSLDLDNTVKAPGSSIMRIRAYHNQSIVEMPQIAELKMWASTDDGAHWKQLQVTQLTRGSDATFKATIVYPKFGDTTGAVSLRAEAFDTNGNSITQTITRAFNLRNRKPSSQ